MSTKIQIITSTIDLSKKTEIAFSYLSNPFAVDMFDINIVDLTDSQIWKHSEKDYYSIDSISDFISLKSIVQNSQWSSIVYVLPPNLCFRYAYDRFAKKYHNSIRLKDILGPLTDNMLSEILPINICDSLIFENSLSVICDENFASSFSFLPNWVELSKLTVLTQANGSNKATTVADGRFIFTTLQITKDEQRLFAYLKGLHLLRDSSDNYPEWLLSYDILDDRDQKTRIDDCLASIQEAKQSIKQAEQKRQENLQYKSILFETGDNLVEGVFRILEIILDVDLSQFKDEKNEDFLIFDDSVTFIGEIKGISTNVKSDNVSQVERHYQAYQDKLQEEGRKETVKQILIINPFRTKPPDQREPVHEIQINLARRYGSLIITTETLLKIFERFLNHTISTADIKKVFSTEVGLLSMEAFGTMKGA